VLVAGADEDAGFDEAQKDRLAAALKDAGVDAEGRIWKGCKHGWVPTDMAVYNRTAPSGTGASWWRFSTAC
jgi:carboxymethylenebutenolidase